MNRTEKTKPAACVLCGGLSIRFGSPKAEARISTKRLMGVCCTYGGFLQPFPALYRKAAAGRLEGMLERGLVAPRSAFELPEFQVLSEEETRAVDPGAQSFLNINTPGDLNGLTS